MGLERWKEGEEGEDVSQEPACWPLRLTRRARSEDVRGKELWSDERRDLLMADMIDLWVPEGAGVSLNFDQKSSARAGTGAGTWCEEKNAWQAS